MKLLIVDDEPLAIKSIKLTIAQKMPEIHVVGAAGNIEEAKALIKKQHPDIVLLDIEMPGGNGFKLLSDLEEIPFQIIFITAYDKYAVKAFEYSAIDYLLKPFEDEKLIEAIQKAMDTQAVNEKALRWETLMENLTKPNSLIVTGHSDTHKLLMSEILFLEADSNYTKIFYSSGETYLSSKTLKHYEDNLPQYDFFRIHHSIIANRKHILHFDKKESKLILPLEKQLTIAQRKMKSFIDWFEFMAM